jgi:hypothetical protein
VSLYSQESFDIDDLIKNKGGLNRPGEKYKYDVEVLKKIRKNKKEE